MHKQGKSGPGTTAVSFEEQFSNSYIDAVLGYITERSFRCPAGIMPLASRWLYQCILNRTDGITINYKYDVRMSLFQHFRKVSVLREDSTVM